LKANNFLRRLYICLRCQR